MNHIDAKFAELRDKKRTALIPFVTIGDPDPETSIDILVELEAAGADLIEFGVPYSDPLADGPVIQRASERALKHRISILDCISAARQARERGVKIPFILFTYYNPVLRLGLERFFDLLKENDISGMIIPDLPIEEDAPVRKLAIQYNIHLIPLVAPTSEARIEKIAASATGFVYCVSSLGVTGVRSEFFAGIDEFLNTVKRSTSLPIAVGFGISNREQVAQFAKTCDGVVVGSAIVRCIEDAIPLLSEPSTRKQGLLQIREFVRKLRDE